MMTGRANTGRHEPAVFSLSVTHTTILRIALNRSRTINAYEARKLEKRLRRKTGEAIVDYNMIEDGDRVMVCLSGGKDSYTLLEMLIHLRKAAPIEFDLVAVNLDQKQPGFPEHVLPEYLQSRGVEYRIEEQDTYSIVLDKIPQGRTMCSLCSRLRRGILYRVAEELGATKIALGHHMDDMVETLFLNMFHGSRMKAMAPKLISDNKNNIVIRPLAYVREKDIARYSSIRQFPIIPCNLCGTQPNLERKKIKKMLRDWEKEAPNRVVSIFRSMHRITPSHLFDRELYDFAGMTVDQDKLPEELDIAFDPAPLTQVS